MKNNLTALRLRVIDSISEFEKLRHEWNQILQKSMDTDKNIFLTWEWQFTWWNHFGQGKQLNIVLLENADGVVAIAPFMRRKIHFGIFKLEVLDNISCDAGDYLGVICADISNGVMQSLLDYLTAEVEHKNTVIHIARIPADTGFAIFLRESAVISNAIQLSLTAAHTCLYTSLPAAFDSFLKTISAKLTKNLGYQKRKLSSDHSLSFREFNSVLVMEDVNQIEQHMELLFNLHCKRWTNRPEEMRGMFASPQGRAFVLALVQALNPTGWVNLSLMLVDERPISGVLGFEYESCYYYLKPAFDPDYAQYSPGQLHILHLIEACIASGIKVFDFLMGAEDYKTRWAKSTRQVLRVRLVKAGLSGKLQLMALNLPLKLARIRRKIGRVFSTLR